MTDPLSSMDVRLLMQRLTALTEALNMAEPLESRLTAALGVIAALFGGSQVGVAVSLPQQPIQTFASPPATALAPLAQLQALVAHLHHNGSTPPPLSSEGQRTTIPLHAQGQTLGLLWVEAVGADEEGARDELLRLVAGQLSQSLAVEASRTATAGPTSAVRGNRLTTDGGEEGVDDLLAELEAERSRLATTIQQMPVAVIVAEAPSGKLIMGNSKVAEIWRHPMLPSQNVEEYGNWRGFHPDGRPYHPDEWPLARAAIFGETLHQHEMVIQRGDDTFGIISVNAAPVLDSNGQPVTAVVIFEDVTERKRDEERQRFLAEVSAVLEEPGEPQAIIDRIARIAVTNFADWCLVDLVGHWPEAPVATTVAHAQPEKEPLIRAALQQQPELVAHYGSPAVIRTGEPLLVTQMPPEVLGAPQSREVVSLIGRGMVHSYLIVPLLARGRVLGALTCVRVEQPLAYTEQDLAQVEEAAQRVALVLDNVRLYQEAQMAIEAKEATLAMLDTLIMRAPVGLAFVDRELRFQHINTYLAAMNGYSVEEHLGRKASELFDVRGVAWERHWQVVLETGKPVTDLELSGPIHGEIRHALVSYYPVQIPGEPPLGVGALVIDVTERKRAEETQRLLAEVGNVLATSMDKHEMLREVTRIPVPSMADLCAVYLDVADNEEQLQIFLFANEPLPQLPAYRVVERSAAPALITEMLKTSQPRLLPNVSLEALDTLPLDPELVPASRDAITRSAIAVPLIVRGQTVGVLTFVSLSPFKFYRQAELGLAEEVARRVALAVENARLYRETQEAVTLRDLFISVAAHELKTPVASIQGYVELLQRRMRQAGQTDERTEKSLDTIRAQSARLVKLVDLLLDVSRLQTGAMHLDREPFDMNALVHQSVEMVQPTLTRHDLSLWLPDEPLIVNGDRVRLEQIVQNLLGNAIKYSPQGGTVTVRLEREQGELILAVADQGIGIPADSLPRLFRPFFRADNAKGIPGTGLGLYVVREIINLHAGSLEVISEPAAGSTFLVRLPLHPDVP